MLTKQGRFHYSGACCVPDARDTLPLPLSISARRATPHILHIKTVNFFANILSSKMKTVL
ncbi:hypothetical protein [Pseudomonas fragariae (ex Marin et al. 2024)]|uniref:hypothetical protein n=1 Tax=Pseudomonas fragariae (ex Marin et al. 2024) TaxID=3080056 RepID=UPI002A24A5F1|nr:MULTISPECIES: hypothetical protein [unclassified Pseudomonas]MDX9624750.1 hypothetical protein [Pseudomonas sp. 20]